MIHHFIHELALKPYTKKGDRVIEFGAQYININETFRGTEENPLFSNEFYPNIDIVSIDLNGEGGALQLDLSKNIAKRDAPEPGDIVTDFGTLEHVKSLYYGLKNAFTLLKVGGIGMHANPLSGGYLIGHGFHYFTNEFWEGFCKMAKLELLDLFVQAAYHNIETGNELYCIYRKLEGSKFPTKKQFDTLYKQHIKKS